MIFHALQSLVHCGWPDKISIPDGLFLRRAPFEREKGTCLLIFNSNSLFSMLTARNSEYIVDNVTVLPLTQPLTPVNNGHLTLVDTQTTTTDSLLELEMLSSPFWFGSRAQVNTSSEERREWIYRRLRSLQLNKITREAWEIPSFLETCPKEEEENESECEYYDVCEDEMEDGDELEDVSEYYDVYEYENEMESEYGDVYEGEDEKENRCPYKN